jgi:hypothetical protein
MNTKDCKEVFAKLGTPTELFRRAQDLKESYKGRRLTWEENKAYGDILEDFGESARAAGVDPEKLWGSMEKDAARKAARLA